MLLLKRCEKFQEKVADIDAHNEGFENGNHTYSRDINQFADMVTKKYNSLLNV